MILNTVSLFLVLNLLADGRAFEDPFQAGPYQVSHHNFSSGSIEGLEENLEVYTPMTAGKYPVLYLFDGLAMGIPGTSYSEIVTHMASHGIAVIVPWMVTIITPENKLPYITSVMEWAEIYLQDLLYIDGVPQDVTLDFETLLASSHSAGSHVLVALLKEGCRNFKGMVLMSPVDGVDAVGLIPEFCITPGEDLNFAIPTLHLEAGFDAVPGITGFACAPEKLSNERFWNALHPQSHRWSINATEFAHCDLVDEEARMEIENSRACSVNEALPQEVFPPYKRFVAGTTVAFFKGLVEENCQDYLQYLEDPSLMMVDATERHVNPTGACPTPYCTWEPVP